MNITVYSQLNKNLKKIIKMYMTIQTWKQSEKHIFCSIKYQL
jgi:hypothetical protein